jgi:hypothetical protein
MSERLILIDRIADAISAHDDDINPNPDVTARTILAIIEDVGWAPPSRVSDLLTANNAEVSRRRSAESRVEQLSSFTTLAEERRILYPDGEPAP